MTNRNDWSARSAGIAVVVALLLASCSSDDASSETPPASDEPSPTTQQADPEPPLTTVEPVPAPDPEPEPELEVEPEPEPEPEVESDPEPEVESDPEPEVESEQALADVRLPTVEALGDSGEGTIAPLAFARIPDGYTEAEYSFAGEATSYESVGALGSDGMWEAEESGTLAPYTSRIIVRAPAPEDFSGVVLVEWNNVTAGTDTTPDWGFLHEMIGREGHAYVAVSAQFVGVMGDDESFLGGGVADIRGLPTKDPARYGNLDHPGDEFAFDIFTQAGAAVLESDVLGGLEPTTVLALGESQSAFFMAGYVNAVHPLVGLYDGFLVHSRGGTATTPEGERGDGEPVNIRTDLDVPVLQYVTETDMFGLGFLPARQPDSGSVRTWEVAGTAHADAYALFASGLDRDPASGSILGCETPINDGPQHETLSAAVHHLVAWAVDGTLPPLSPLLDVEGDSFVRDELGLATGGVRTPPVDAPLRTLTGDAGPDGGSCFLFGQTLPFDDGVLATLYGSLADWSSTAQASADAAVAAGWLLPEDAASMLEESTTLAVSLGLS